MFDIKGEHEVLVMEHQMVLHHTSHNTDRHDLSDGLVALCASNAEGDHIIPLLPASPCADPRSMETTDECEDQSCDGIFPATLDCPISLGRMEVDSSRYDSKSLFSHLGHWSSVRLMI